MAHLTLVGLNKVFAGDVQAVRDVDLTVEDGELLVMLGPSGCGKTTVLRMIAGLEEVTSGRIELDGRLLNNVSERDRDIAMVFQTYALYPHMSAYRNIEYPLRHHKVPKDERERRVRSVAATLGLSDLLDKRPAALSGGQRQRVAMGRAIVREPRLFLMDEPLSNLDAALRVQVRTEIHALQQRLGITTVYVTHDQVEAMTLGSRVAVMRGGVLQQVGPPDDVYQHPANTFVAAFMGSPGMTIFKSRAVREGDTLSIGLGDHMIEVDASEHHAQPALLAYAGRDIIVGIRPEGLGLCEASGSSRRLRGKVGVQEVLGSSVVVFFAIEGSQVAGGTQTVDRVAVSANGDAATGVTRAGELTPVRFPSLVRFAPGEVVDLCVAGGAMRFFDPDTGRAL